MKKALLIIPVSMIVFGCNQNSDKAYNSKVTLMQKNDMGGVMSTVKICNQQGGVASIGQDFYDEKDCYKAEVRCFIGPDGVYKEKGLYCRITELKKI